MWEATFATLLQNDMQIPLVHIKQYETLFAGKDIYEGVLMS